MNYFNYIENFKFLMLNVKMIFAIAVFGCVLEGIAMLIDHRFIQMWGLSLLAYASLSGIVYLKWGRTASTRIHCFGLTLFILIIAIITY